MTDIDWGGQAFPTHISNGMTLRDYIAIKMAVEMFKTGELSMNDTARRAYTMADCMLKASRVEA